MSKRKPIPRDKVAPLKQEFIAIANDISKQLNDLFEKRPDLTNLIDDHFPVLEKE